ncbi:MAG: VOC family protein [Chitinophagaceae bacterium]
MSKINSILIVGIAAFTLGFFSRSFFKEKSVKEVAIHQKGNAATTMKLGAFSISLSVKDLSASKQFYEQLGFVEFGGGMDKHYLIMKNENTLIGLFQGMFEGNMLTFNPGWDENAKNIDEFDDVRKIQQHLKSQGISINPEADEKTSGPASLMTKDPDGNVILIDQHR